MSRPERCTRTRSMARRSERFCNAAKQPAGDSTVFDGGATGTLIVGQPIDQSRTCAGAFLGHLGWRSLSLGVPALSLFAMHGAINLYQRTEGELQQMLRGWIAPRSGFSLSCTRS